MQTVPTHTARDNLLREVDEYLEEYSEWLSRQRDLRADAEGRRLFKALMLAPDLSLCRALLQGERVPWPRLDYFQAVRFGLKHAPPDGRVSLDDFNDVRMD